MTAQQIINDRYKVVTVLNHGSFGVVSLAKDTWHKNTLVALKCIHKHKESTAAIDEAKEEIAVHERLGNFEYVAPLLDHFETEDSTFLVMEYYPDGDLYEAIRSEKGPRDSGTILEFMLQLIDAVEYAHSRGVYHRDIKPENILIASDGSVRLADWGLSTRERENSEFGVGSERYMAPELFDKSIDCYDAEKADIWSLGICLLNIIFARNPFTIASQKDKLFLDFAASREALFDIFPTLSCDVFAVLRHALTIDPDNRSLEKMREELFNVSIWTTDDEYYYDDDEEYMDRAVSLESFVEEVDPAILLVTPAVSATAAVEAPVSTPVSVSAASIATPKLMSIVPTTVDREPFRTPTLLEESEELSNSFAWDRTMQFTPPNPTFFRQEKRKKHGASRLSQVISKDPSLAAMEPVSEEDEVFAMDGLGTALSHIEQSPSGTSDSSTISSVPSLVQSSQTFSEAPASASLSQARNPFLSKPASASVAIPKPAVSSIADSHYATGASQPQGKSWSDLIFDDEEDFDEDQLMQALSSIPKLAFGNMGPSKPLLATSNAAGPAARNNWGLPSSAWDD